MKKSVVVLMAIVMVAISCKKEENTSPDYLSGLLKKRTWNDGMVEVFEYDSQKRLMKETCTDDGETTVYSYEYDESGRISKISGTENGQVDYKVDYEWDGNKVTKLTSSLNNGNWESSSPEVFEFDTDGKLVKQETYRTTVSTSDLTGYTEYTWQNGNIVSGIEYDQSGSEIGTYAYEYVDKPNISPYANVDFWPIVVSKNIMKVVSSNHQNGSTTSETRYSYTYSEGSTLPESVVITYIYNGNQQSIDDYDCEYY